MYVSEPTSPVSCLPPAQVKFSVNDAMSEWLVAIYIIAESLTVAWVATLGVGFGVGVGVADGWLTIALYPMYTPAIKTITTTATTAIKIDFFILYTH
jgi:hypothetical protein